MSHWRITNIEQQMQCLVSETSGTHLLWDQKCCPMMKGPDRGSSVGRRVTVLVTSPAVFAQGNKTWSSQSLRCWKHHSTKSPETKTTSVQKAGGKPAVPGESQHGNRYCDEVRASPFGTNHTWEPSVQPERMSSERAGMLGPWLPEAMVMAKLGCCVARSCKRPVSTLQNGSALWGAIQHSEKLLLIKIEYLKNCKQLWKHSPEMSGEEWRVGSWAKAIGKKDGENNVGDSTPLQNCQLILQASAGKTGPERSQMTWGVVDPFCSRNQEIIACIYLQSAIEKGHLLFSQTTQLLVMRCSFLTMDNQQGETGPCLIFWLPWLVPGGLLLKPLPWLTPQAEGCSSCCVPPPGKDTLPSHNSKYSWKHKACIQLHRQTP